MSDDRLISDGVFSNDERVCLEALLGHMIPASEDYAVPGADDPLILQDVLTTARSAADGVIAALRALDALAQTHHGQQFAELDPVSAADIAVRFRSGMAAHAGQLAGIAVTCYYRDDRVMQALDMQARPPFPAGFTVEEGDFSLLEPVRQRGKFYREVDQ